VRPISRRESSRSYPGMDVEGFTLTEKSITKIRTLSSMSASCSLKGCDYRSSRHAEGATTPPWAHVPRHHRDGTFRRSLIPLARELGCVVRSLGEPQKRSVHGTSGHDSSADRAFSEDGMSEALHVFFGAQAMASGVTFRHGRDPERSGWHHWRWLRNGMSRCCRTSAPLYHRRDAFGLDPETGMRWVRETFDVRGRPRGSRNSDVASSAAFNPGRSAGAPL